MFQSVTPFRGGLQLSIIKITIIFVNKSKINAEGTAPILLRITIGGRKTASTVHHRIRPRCLMVSRYVMSCSFFPRGNGMPRFESHSLYIVGQTVTPRGPRTKKAATGAAFFGLGSRVGDGSPGRIFEESMSRSLRWAKFHQSYTLFQDSIFSRVSKIRYKLYISGM